MSEGVRGRLYGAGGSRSEAATLYREAEVLRWVNDGGDELGLALLAECDISDAPSAAAAFVTLPDGRRFETPDGRALEALGAGVRSFRRSWLSRLEGHGGAVLLAVVVTALLLYGGVRFAVPVIAGQVAEAVPPGVAQDLDRAVLKAFDEGVLDPTTLSEEEQNAVAALLTPLLPGLPAHVAPKLAFRDGGERVGPNAFALPGGQIVVTDAIVRRLNPAELQAVLAHELSHGAARHSLRRALQFSGLAVLWSWVTGDLGALLTLIPVTIMELSYARDFEFEADAAAVRRLLAAGQDPRALGQALARLQPEDGAGDAPSYLSTHPSTAERRKALEAAIAREAGTQGRF